jgi:hypothetical protein
MSFIRFLKVAYVVEHYLHVPEWYHTPKTDLWINSYGAPKFRLGGRPLVDGPWRTAKPEGSLVDGPADGLADGRDSGRPMCPRPRLADVWTLDNFVKVRLFQNCLCRYRKVIEP